MLSLSLLSAVVAAPVSGKGAAPAMRDPTYRGVKRVAILAQYGPAGEVAGGAESATLCAEMLALAMRAAPVPVTCARIGDPVLTQPGTMVVVAQASVTTPPGGGTALFAVAVRPHWDGGLEPAPIFFGAAPRVASYSQTATGRAARSRALEAALADVLPWGHQGKQRPMAGINRE